MTNKLAERIKTLIKENNSKELEDLLLNTDEDWILEILNSRIHRAEGPEWLGGLLLSLSCTTRESTSLRVKIYEDVLRKIRNESTESERGAIELVGVLMMHTDAFPINALISLVDLYSGYLEEGSILQGRWLDLLAKLITTLSQKEEITVDGKQMSGEDYRYQVLKSFCDFAWSGETTVGLLPVFRGIDLPKEELQDVIFKVERVLKEVDYQSVPPIIYHLILLVKEKHLGQVLKIVIDYFNKQEEKLNGGKDKDKGKEKDCILEDNTEEIDDMKRSGLAEAQGTVILHITDLAQYNPGLVRDYVKYVKSTTWLPEIVITPFNLALTLSLASIEKYKDQVLDSIKSCLLRSFREEERSKQSQWLREAWGEHCNITQAFKTTIENCIMGWDQVSESLVELGFSLLESGSGPKGETYSARQAVALASVILPLILKKQTHMAQPIISRLSNFIVSASSPLQYIDIMGKLAKTSPLVLLEHQNLIRELLEYLVFLPLSAARHLLHALLPLLKMSMTLKDSLMIILRKMLFSKQGESRQVAVCGFLQFLRHFRVIGTLPSSQASMTFSSSLSVVSVSADVHSVFNNSTNEALCLELLGVLRRCFSQQHQVKSTLYQGLHEVSQANPKLTLNILELLLQHVKVFLDVRDETFNPIILKKVICVQGDTVTLVEPLGDLLACLVACKLFYEDHREKDGFEDMEDDEEHAISVLNEICSCFDVLSEKLCGCGLDDLDLDTKGEYSASSAAGQKNILSAKVIVAVLDCLIEHAYLSGAHTSDEKLQTVISLFKTQRKIIDVVKERSSKTNKKGESSKSRGRTPTAKTAVTFKSHLSLRVIVKMLALSLHPSDDDNPECSRMIKANSELLMYLLVVVEETLSSVKGMTKSERERILPHLRSISTILLHECSNNVATSDSSDERFVMRQRQSLLVLSSLIAIFCKYYESKLESIMREMTGKTDSKPLNSLLHKIIKKCQKILLRILHNEERTPLLKDALTVVSIMSTVSQAMDTECPETKEIQDWVLTLCKDQDVDHSGVAEATMNLVFILSNQVKANHNLTRGIAQDLHCRFGDMEQDVELEDAAKYKIVTEDTATIILATLLSHLEDSLSLIELSLSKAKAHLLSGVEYDNARFEKYISTKFAVVIHSVHEIILSALPLGTSTDQTIKVVTKLYNNLSLYVKFYLDIFRMKPYAQISDRFEKIVHLSGQLVSVPIYPSITYIEGAQRQVGKKSKGPNTARAIKESRLIPSLIFAIEHYESQLILLSKKSKVNLMQEMKLSTSRDFRIMPQMLMEELQKENEKMQEEDNEAEEEGNENEGGNAQEAVNEANINSESKKGNKRKSDTGVSEGNENDRNSQNKTNSASAKKKKNLSNKKVGRK